MFPLYSKSQAVIGDTALRRRQMNIKKRKKYGLVVSIIIFFILLVIASMVSIEVNKFSKLTIEDDRQYETKYKYIQPFNYNTNAVYVWFVGIIIISLVLYITFVERKEVNINKTQTIILAIAVPVIIFIGFFANLQILYLSALYDAWLFIIVMLVFIAVFEYDLFGNKIIISFFNFKLLIKMIILSIILFLIIGVLGENIPPITKTTTSLIIKD